MKNSQADRLLEHFKRGGTVTSLNCVNSLVLFLRQNFTYDQITGLLVRANYVGGGAKVGTEAGYIRDDGYRVISCNRKRVLTHRAIWLYVHGEEPNGFIDHINGNKSDNRICNLRVVNKSENGLNRDKQINNKTGFKGVCFDKSRNKFIAQTKVNGKHYFIGRFKQIEDAVLAYENFCVNLHGEYFYKNNAEYSLALDLKAAA